MTKLDQAIRDALTREDAEFLAKFDSEAPITEQVFGAFGGRWGPINVLGALVTVLAFAFFVYCLWQIGQTDDLRMTVLLAAGAIVSAMFVSILKVWFWMELQKNQVLREVKRLELQVARLATRDAV